MFGLGVASLILGYALLYTAADNLTHQGNGHTLFQNLGLTTTIDLGEKQTPVLSGAPPQQPQNPIPGGTISI